jgi:glutathione S-transferase
MTESNAIIRYLGRKHGLDGKTEVERIRIDMMENIALSFYMEFAKIAYSPEFVRIYKIQNSVKPTKCFKIFYVNCLPFVES